MYNNDYVGIGSFNIFVGVFVATVFGAAFFFDLFWPERFESRGVKLAWRICSVLACVLTLTCALPYTYIVSTKRAYPIGIDEAATGQLLSEFGKKNPLVYRRNPRAVASVVFLWPGMVFTFIRCVGILTFRGAASLISSSTFLLWHSIAHIDANGPKSTHARVRDAGMEKPDAGPEASVPTQHNGSPAP